MSEQAVLNQSQLILSEVFEEFRSATILTRSEKAQRLLSRIDLESDSREGIVMIFKMIGKFVSAGIFDDSAWSSPSKLVPALVHATMKSGHPGSTIELLSELRMLAIAEGTIVSDTVSPDEAENYIKDVLVSNFEFVYDEPMEETRLFMSNHERRKAHTVFSFLLEHTSLEKIKQKLAEEIRLSCMQRPVVTEKQRKLIGLIRDKFSLDPDRHEDKELLTFQNCIYRPTVRTSGKDGNAYQNILAGLSQDELKEEARQMSKSMQETGLVSRFHVVLLRHLVEKKHTDILPVCLGLSLTGEAKWKKHEAFVSDLILRVIQPYNEQCIYGLANMLESDMFSREVIRMGISNLYSIRIHPAVKERIMKSSRASHDEVSPQQYLIGSVIRILGQPLGVRQGNNPTCQSARGISMWSQFAPARLINMLQTAAVHNDLTLRFEDREVKSSETGKGLVQTLDYNLDAVSVTLVPILDKIYNEMMRRATGRGEDPHKWVNPALYGQWIQVGFASAYDYLSSAIVDFKGFVRIFYAMCHPEYNGGFRLVYPNPVGIYITSSKGEMMGFHAISLLRVEKHKDENYRAYFLNPNSEGRQDWGQNITPTVFGNGERYGESSLPLHEFAARVYAFHYNSLETPEKAASIPDNEVMKVYTLSKDSWGKSYVWIDTQKQW